MLVAYGGVATWRHNLYLVWLTCDTCDGHSFWATFRRSTDGGSAFEPYQRLFPANDVAAMAAEDSTVLFLWLDRALSGRWLAVSADLGSTWQHTEVWYRFAQKLFLKEGVLHLIQASQGTQRAEVAYRRSTDLGQSWSAESILTTVDNHLSAPEDAVLQARFGGNVYVAWRDGKYGGTNLFVGSILLRRSTDWGVTWETEVLLTDIPSGIDPAIGISDSLVGVVWNNESQPFQGISLRLSTDRGTSWMPHVAVTDSTRRAGSAAVAISGATLYVVWVDSRTGLSQVYLRRSRVFHCTCL